MVSIKVKSRPSRTNGTSFFAFMQEVISKLKQQGKTRTSETYLTTLNSFMRFRRGKDLSLDEVDANLMVTYETWLRSKNISMNTISFYMRILRATYNRAVEKGQTLQQYPFKPVYTGIEKTAKRAIPLRAIQQIKALDLTSDPPRRYARDMFLLCFYTRGMSLIDMAFLKKRDITNGILSYRRKKTGQQLFIKWETCMQEIIDQYDIPDSPYLLPIISKPGTNERKQYINESHRINRHLKNIGKELGLPLPLTLYVARHTWASIAKSENISISVISEALGHNSETTTRIYLASLDTTTIDNANKLILNLLQ